MYHWRKLRRIWHEGLILFTGIKDVAESGRGVMLQLDRVDTISSEREMLVRFCARYTGDPDVAEDLAQQALLDAWRREHQLRDPKARRGWLLSIARNSCLMWGRARSRELSHRACSTDADGREPDYRLTDDFDVEVELERGELAQLLDRALALLPAETRDVLIERYLKESPQAELAARLGLTEGAVEARLQRGKLALRKVFTTELADEAVANGLVVSGEAGWQGTRIWCPGCGKHRLEGWLRPGEGKLYMRCPGCSRSDAHFIHSDLGEGLRNVKSYKPAVSRVLKVIHELLGTNGGWRCAVPGVRAVAADRAGRAALGAGAVREPREHLPVAPAVWRLRQRDLALAHLEPAPGAGVLAGEPADAVPPRARDRVRR